MREFHHGSWEQTASFLGSQDTLDADGHRRGAMRNLMLFRAPDHLTEGVLENAEEFIGHFHLAPKKALQSLDPFEIGNNYAAGIAKNVRNHKHLVPALFKDEVGFGSGGTIGAFGENAALQLRGILRGDDTIDRRWNENITRQGEQFVWIDTIALIKSSQVAFFEHML